MKPLQMRGGDSRRQEDEESRWPRDWRPYAALLSGFCGMANSWFVIYLPRMIFLRAVG